jgi:hypothetical protein
MTVAVSQMGVGFKKSIGAKIGQKIEPNLKIRRNFLR